MSHLAEHLVYRPLVYRRIRGRTIRSHLTYRQRYALYSAAREIQGNCYVEIGSYLGASANVIGQALVDQGGQGRLHCVDTWQNTAMSEGGRDTWTTFLDNIQPYKGVIECHKGWSHEVARGFHEPIDFLFIDGDHSYEGAKQDVCSWLPKVRAGGAVAMHDIGWSDGVQRVVAEYFKPVARRERCLPNLYMCWL